MIITYPNSILFSSNVLLFSNQSACPAFQDSQPSVLPSLPTPTAQRIMYARRFVSVLQKEIVHLYHGHIVNCDFLLDLFSLMAQATYNPNIKVAMKKQQGYLSRFFSNETWEDWVEDKTAIGKVVFAFSNYIENPYLHPKRFIQSLTPEIVKKANEHAIQLLKNVRELEKCVHIERDAHPHPASPWEGKLLNYVEEPKDSCMSHRKHFLPFQEGAQGISSWYSSRGNWFVLSVQKTSSWLSFPPGANADETEPLCSSMQVLKDTQEKVHRERQLQIDTSEAQKWSNDSPMVVVTNHKGDSDISTPQRAKAYIERMLGLPIASPEKYCLAEESILLIKNTKKPDPEQMEGLKKAYDQLLKLANEDVLAPCNLMLMELFDGFCSDSHNYFIDVLHPLPELLTSLLSKSSTGYTGADLELLATKINEISIKMVAILQKTNETKLLLRLIDVMLDSAEKNAEKIEVIVSTFEAALEVLRSNGDSVEWKQKKTLRKMAKLHKASLTTHQKQAVAEEILEITQSSIYVLRLIQSYLEEVPDDIQRLEACVQDIGAAFSRTAAVKETTILTITMIILSKTPTRIRNAGLVIVLGRVLYNMFAEHSKMRG
jgi:hypothetical protein